MLGAEVGAGSVALVQLVLDQKPVLPLGVSHELALLSGPLRGERPAVAAHLYLIKIRL